MNILNKAIIIAATQHNGQTYGKSVPYIVHPLEVMQSVLTEYPSDAKLAVVAVLHDAIEDTPLTFVDIEKEFGIRIALAVGILSREKGEDYESYIRNMCLLRSTEGAMARIVKRHDLRVNTFHLETSTFSDEKKERLAGRYAKALRSMPSPQTDRSEYRRTNTNMRWHGKL